MDRTPNIVLIMTDQQRADLRKLEGYPLDTMPFLDALATQGTWFDRAYTASPTCLPARSSMFTGRFPSATGIRSNAHHGTAHCEKTLLEVLHERGYVTALCGKDHSGLDPSGFDSISGYSHGGSHRQPERTEAEIEVDAYLDGLHHATDPSPAPHTATEQCPARIVRDSIQWCTQQQEADQPYFLWMSIPEPHNPYQVPAEYFDLFPADSLPEMDSPNDEWTRRGFKYEFTHWMLAEGYANYDEVMPQSRSNYHGMLRLIDDQLERFVAYLDETGQRDNTILVFVSDHGDFCGEYGLMRKGPEIPNVLARIPMQWSGPGIVARDQPHTAHVSLCDVMPTLCEAIGAEIPLGVQGRSLWPMLTGQPYPEAEFDSVIVEQGMGGLHYVDSEEIIDPHDDGLTDVFADCLNSRSQSGSMRMVRKGDWTMQLDMQGRGQLYHLPSDSAELCNRYDDPKAIAVRADLLAAIARWTICLTDVLPAPSVNGRYKLKLDPHNYTQV